MNWADLRYALVVAREGSVTEAARVLGVAHTTVYRRVNGLEEQHGVRFFDRTGPSWTLTEAGRELLDVGADVEQRFQAFERRLRGRDQRLEGIVTVTTVEPLAVLLTRLLHRFQSLHPDIQVVLRVGNDLVVVGREADIALRVTRAPPENLRGRCLCTIGFAVYASSALLHDGPIDRSTAPWVCFGGGSASTPQGRWEQANVDESQVALRTDSRAVFTEAVSLGTGIGVLPCGLAADLPHLVPLTPTLPELGLPLWLLTHDDLAPMPRVRVLLDFVADAVGSMKPALEGLDH